MIANVPDSTPLITRVEVRSSRKLLTHYCSQLGNPSFRKVATKRVWLTVGNTKGILKLLFCFVLELEIWFSHCFLILFFFQVTSRPDYLWSRGRLI